MRDGARPSVFVGIGVGTYDDAHFEPLPRAVADVHEIAEVLAAHGCETRLAPADPTESMVRDHLDRELPADGLGGEACLVLLWAGHGNLLPDPAVHLIARDTRRDATPWIKASDLAGVAARSGARQILLVLDTCYSGDAGLPALEVLNRVLNELAATERTAWAGVLTSTLPLGTARDGLFGRRLLQVLNDGPRDPLLRRRWSPHDARIRLEDIADALTYEWDGQAQAPTFQRHGAGRPVFPNPLFDPGATPAIVEHLLLAARGGDPGEERSFFTGRAEPLDGIVRWMRAGDCGVLVVTGPAGTGKSAIVGRIVSLSEPDERARILGGGTLEHADPGPSSVHAHVHARGLVAEDLVAQIDRRLAAAGVIPLREEGPRNRGELFGALERVDTTPVIAIDGLDEAGAEAWSIAEDVVRLLRTHAQFLIGTRDLQGSSLVEALAPDVVVDLGDDRLAAQTADDVMAYVAKRLADVDPERMDPLAIGRELVRSAATTGEGAFLLARIVTAQLRTTPIDTAAAAWERSLATAVETALERDLVDIPPLVHETGTVDDAARELLTALAWSYGAGMPDDVWAVAAGALSPTGATYDRDDVLWLLQHAGRYVVEAGESGRAVYRLAHQHLVDVLLPSRRIDRVAGPAARLSAELAAYYRAQLEAGARIDEPAYVWHYAWRHAGDGGTSGVEAFRTVVEIAGGALLPDLAAALNYAANRSADVGLLLEAVAPAEEAMQLYREIAAAAPVYLPNLASALSNLGIRYSLVGRNHEAVTPTEEAVDLYRELAAENPAVLPDLASTLSNLGGRYREVGRRVEAVAPVEEAARLYRELAAENAKYLPEVAMALNNLGSRYSDLGRDGDALALNREAVELRRQLAAENPGFLPNLAGALNNLSIRYGRLRRYEEALEVIEEAIVLRRQLAAENPGAVPDLATALNNVGIVLGELARREEALEAIEEALALRRQLAAENPVYLPNLASALNNLGVNKSAIGQHEEALALTQEAVELRRQLAAENPGFLPSLAGTLNNLGIRYGLLGRYEEAIEANAEAVELYEPLAVENPGHVRDLADALTNLEVCYTAVGRPDADAVWERALARLVDEESRALLLRIRAERATG